jgi:hypothetical protein
MNAFVEAFIESLRTTCRVISGLEKDKSLMQDPGKFYKYLERAVNKMSEGYNSTDLIGKSDDAITNARIESAMGGIKDDVKSSIKKSDFYGDQELYEAAFRKALQWPMEQKRNEILNAFEEKDKPLLDGLRELCQHLGIKEESDFFEIRDGYGALYDGYQAEVAAIKENDGMEALIKEINDPEKWEKMTSRGDKVPGGIKEMIVEHGSGNKARLFMEIQNIAKSRQGQGQKINLFRKKRHPELELFYKQLSESPDATSFIKGDENDSGDYPSVASGGAGK